MIEIKWMIFRVEGEDVFYFFRAGASQPGGLYMTTNPQIWYWTDALASPVPDEELALLNEIVNSPRKRTFSIKRQSNRRYQVTDRGTFQLLNEKQE